MQQQPEEPRQELRGGQEGQEEVGSSCASLEGSVEGDIRAIRPTGEDGGRGEAGVRGRNEREGVEVKASIEASREGRGETAQAGEEGATDSSKEEGKEEEEQEQEQEEGEEEEQEQEQEEGEEEEEVEPGYGMARVCDRLMDVFAVERPQPSEWRKLLALSREWRRIRPHFFRRCRERAAQCEGDRQHERAEQLYRLARRLEEVGGLPSGGRKGERRGGEEDE